MSQLKFDDYFVGFSTVPSPVASSLISVGPAPSNYKRPEAIREYEQKARETAMEKAAETAFVGSVYRIAVADPEGREVLHLSAGREEMSGPGGVACEFVHWMLQNEFDRYPFSVGTGFTPSRRLWGFDVDQFLRMVGVEVLKYGKASGLSQRMPLRLWYQNTGARDPYEILTGGAERKALDVNAVLTYFNRGIVQADWKDPERAMNCALAAKELCESANLL